MEIKIKLKETLTKQGMSQKELAERTGLRANVISEMVNNQRTTVNREHLAKVCDVLKITDFNDILEWD